MIELLIVLALIVLNGIFALSELAVVSSRQSRLKTLAAAGRVGGRRALALAADPGRFLSTVQIGITLIGILNGAFSGATFGRHLSDALMDYGLAEGTAEPLGFGIIIVGITYLSLVIGELVPKQLALRNAEVIACAVAPFMTALSRVAAPLVWLLDSSTKLVFRLLGKTTKPEGRVTEEEIKTLIAEAESTGVLEAEEHSMMVGVLRLGDRAVKGLMTPRTDVDWINLAAGETEIRRVLTETAHSLLPVGDGSVDMMIGVVQARTLLAAVLQGKPLNVQEHVRPAPIVTDTMEALDVMTTLREADVKIALVHDEYGHFEGVVTPADILETLAGFTAGAEVAEPKAVQRHDGSWLLSGWMPADEMAETLGFVLPERRDYQTVAGFILANFQHIPKVGERCTILGWQFEVADLDGRRIDKILATRLPIETRPRFQTGRGDI